MLKIVVWSFTEGKDLLKIFEELQTSDGLGDISSFSDDNILIVVATAAAVSDILDNHSESFVYAKIAEKI